MTEPRLGEWLFISVVGFAIIVALLSLNGAVALSIYVDANPTNQTTMTANSVGRLWTVGSSALSFVFGLMGGKRL